MSYKNTEAYKAHQLIGFPKIDHNIQFEMLVKEDYRPIKDLCPEFDRFPFGLLYEYITITKNEMKEYLNKIKYIEQQLDSYSKTYDGYWILAKGNGFQVFERERGNEFNHKFFSSEGELLNHLIDKYWPYCK